jgi:hypothetical protein
MTVLVGYRLPEMPAQLGTSGGNSVLQDILTSHWPPNTVREFAPFLDSTR